MREVADQTRKATAQGSFFLFFSMLIGAFIASVAGLLAAGNATSCEKGMPPRIGTED